ncbi:MAG: hypothetical protein N4A59_07695 [Marinifilum sp.]|jgi:Fe2+ or Zn2+ uptake regulation protein|nr:hypothetical protein [Marinifilum sp.]
MGYNKRNLLIKIIEVQNIYVEHSKRGATAKWIFNELIHPKFRISRATFYNYLGTNAKKELKELDANNKEKRLAESS